MGPWSGLLNYTLVNCSPAATDRDESLTQRCLLTLSVCSVPWESRSTLTSRAGCRRSSLLRRGGLRVTAVQPGKTPPPQISFTLRACARARSSACSWQPCSRKDRSNLRFKRLSASHDPRDRACSSVGLSSGTQALECLAGRPPLLRFRRSIQAREPSSLVSAAGAMLGWRRSSG